MAVRKGILFLALALIFVGLVGLNEHLSGNYSINEEGKVFQQKSTGLLTGAAIALLNSPNSITGAATVGGGTGYLASFSDDFSSQIDFNKYTVSTTGDLTYDDTQGNIHVSATEATAFSEFSLETDDFIYAGDFNVSIGISMLDLSDSCGTTTVVLGGISVGDYDVSQVECSVVYGNYDELGGQFAPTLMYTTTVDGELVEQYFTPLHPVLDLTETGDVDGNLRLEFDDATNTFSCIFGNQQMDYVFDLDFTNAKLDVSSVLTGPGGAPPSICSLDIHLDDFVFNTEHEEEVVIGIQAVEDCGVVGDEDGNGLADCADFFCDGYESGAGGEPCQPNGEVYCNDLFDNDNDGLTDCADDNCSEDGYCDPNIQALGDYNVATGTNATIAIRNTDCTGELGCQLYVFISSDLEFGILNQNQMVLNISSLEDLGGEEFGIQFPVDQLSGENHIILHDLDKDFWTSDTAFYVDSGDGDGGNAFISCNGGDVCEGLVITNGTVASLDQPGDMTFCSDITLTIDPDGAPVDFTSTVGPVMHQNCIDNGGVPEECDLWIIEFDGSPDVITAVYSGPGAKVTSEICGIGDPIYTEAEIMEMEGDTYFSVACNGGDACNFVSTPNGALVFYEKGYDFSACIGTLTVDPSGANMQYTSTTNFEMTDCEVAAECEAWTINFDTPSSPDVVPTVEGGTETTLSVDCDGMEMDVLSEVELMEMFGSDGGSFVVDLSNSSTPADANMIEVDSSSSEIYVSLPDSGSPDCTDGGCNYHLLTSENFTVGISNGGSVYSTNEVTGNTGNPFIFTMGDLPGGNYYLLVEKDGQWSNFASLQYNPPMEICNNKNDDDGDFAIDCADNDCVDQFGFNGELCEPFGETDCMDGFDNDGDTKIDCADDNCDENEACAAAEICDDGQDNDGDFDVDCDDVDCDADPACAFFSVEELRIYMDLDSDNQGVIVHFANGEVNDSILDMNNFAIYLGGDSWGDSIEGVSFDNMPASCVGSEAGLYTCVRVDFSQDVSSPAIFVSGAIASSTGEPLDNGCGTDPMTCQGTGDYFETQQYCVDNVGEYYACAREEDPYCDDGIDNDGDTLFDYDDWADGGCVPPEDCTNGIDDNFDGTVDCDDEDCFGDPYCNPSGVSLSSPLDGAVIQSNAVTFTYTTSTPADCVLFSNFFGEFDMDDYSGSQFTTDTGEFDMVVPTAGTYLWNVYCDDGGENVGFAFADRTVVINGTMPECFDLEPFECGNTEDCTWQEYPDGNCIIDCFQYDGVDLETCEGAFGGDLCEWDDGARLCDPFFFDKGFEGFSFCADYHGNLGGCGSFPDDCLWFDEPNCQEGDPCYQEVNPGWCESKELDFDNDNMMCYQFDGDELGCQDAKNTLGWACGYDYDPWANNLVVGTEPGFCNELFGSGAGSGNCGDYPNEGDCNQAAEFGMPCSWEGTSTGNFCAGVGCWEYSVEGECPLNKGCSWNDNGYCENLECWQLTENDCYSSSSFGLDCSWMVTGASGVGYCQMNGCEGYDRDQTACEANSKCRWDDPYCNNKNCNEFSNTDESTCEDISATGRNCEWRSQSGGWCSQPGCESFDGTNQGTCEDNGMGLDCTWDNDNAICYGHVVAGCSEYDGLEYSCKSTGWCSWDPSNSLCLDREEEIFNNPGCWLLSGNQTVCESQLLGCGWDGTECYDDTIGVNGIQCEDITNNQLCGNIASLESCCQWAGEGCISAPYIDTCRSNLQEPPVGANSCDDYNARDSQALCEQIAGDPWYMPCVWENNNCMFNYAQFEDEDSFTESSCQQAGYTWITNSWTTAEGYTQYDSWCDFSTSSGTESCEDSCWACEYQNDGTAWNVLANARVACEDSSRGCQFFPDGNSDNGLGWCEFDTSKQGNCDDRCGDCWSQTLCGDSSRDCEWHVDTFTGEGWCDRAGEKTCNDDCYNCFTTQGCEDSSVGCSWDTNDWYCKPDGTANGEVREICFDGIDNDNNGFVDCADSFCMYDGFCGGAELFGVDCVGIENTEACGNQEECIWIVDPWNGNEWCDMRGAHCWTLDDEAGACDADADCQYQTMDSFSTDENVCVVNKALIDETSCWNYGTQIDCGSQQGCAWNEDPYCSENPDDEWCSGKENNGWCDAEIFTCHQLDNSQSACDADPKCAWMQDHFDPNNGYCDPVCFSRENGDCTLDVDGQSGVCEMMSSSDMGWCEPTKNFRGCWDYSPEECEGDDACVRVDDQFGSYCEDKFTNNFFSGMDESWPFEIAWEECNSGEYEQSDICFLGLKEGQENFAFEINTMSAYQTAVCEEKFPETFNSNSGKTANFFVYVDSNGDHANGCSPDDDANLQGFDLKFKYNSKLQDGELTESKVAYKCVDSRWSPTEITISPQYKRMCHMVNGVSLALSKEDLDKLKVLGLYSKGADLQIYATTATEGYSRDNPYDTIGPAWYTPGAADFKFEDCGGFSDQDGDGFLPSEDPDCTDFLRNGYITFEKGWECDDDKDNDGNGLVDCEDPGCVYDEYYCDASNVNDKTSPEVVWLEEQPLLNGMVIGVDTNERTNATLMFYKNDSYCFNISDGFVIPDWKLSNDFEGDDYDLWHDFFVDQLSFNEMGLAHTFTPGETIYYKLKLCDKSGNCKVSACNGVNSSSTEEDFVFGMDLPPPGADITQPLGKLVVLFDIDGDGVFGDLQIAGGDGIRMNASSGRGVDIKFTNPSSTLEWSVTFFGADIMAAKSIDIMSAFKVNGTDSELVGMSSAKWSELAQSLGVDYIKVVMPKGQNDFVDYSTAVTRHCPDDVSTVNDTSCVDLSSGDADCTIGATTTTCTIPVSVGFSMLGLGEEGDGGGDVEEPAEEEPESPETPAGDTGGSSGGSGGGGSGGGTAAKTYIVNADQFEKGYSKELGIGDRIKVTIEDEVHYITLNATYNNRVKVIVESDPQEAVIYTTKTAYFEVTGDKDLDLGVRLDAINQEEEMATLFVKEAEDADVIEKMEGSLIIERPKGDGFIGKFFFDAGENIKYFFEDVSEGKTSSVAWLIGVAALVLIIAVFSFTMHHRKHKETKKAHGRRRYKRRKRK
jgi:hypothetical protein